MSPTIMSMTLQRFLLFVLTVFTAVPFSKGAPIDPSPSPSFLRSVPFNFTLTALNVTLPNANTTGAPLVLGQNGATGGATLQVTSTYQSYPYDEYPWLALIGGQVRAFSKYNEWITNATSVISGRPMGWLTSRIYHSTPTDYSIIPIRNGDRNVHVLAVNGHWDLWSLCPFTGFRGQTNVVFNVSDSPVNPGYDKADCYSVWLNVIPHVREPLPHWQL